AGRAGRHRERRVEAGRQTIGAAGRPDTEPDHVLDRRQYDLRGERQRGDRRPRGDGAVVRAKGGATRQVVIKAAFDAIDEERGRPGTVARRQPPAAITMVAELEGVPDRVLLMHAGRPAAVLEVVDATGPHEVVLEATEIDPDV